MIYYYKNFVLIYNNAICTFRFIIPNRKNCKLKKSDIESASVFETQNTDLIVEYAMEVPENEGENYEDHHNDRTETAVLY